ncbi:MAG: hypothetical protein E4H14_06675 [Candidatus Thorarchaeota archaeon]|nr:MAG: hypothetical protein E4H14_06675 [Candidatus Thorarchaeota archaeon]
MQSGIKIRGIIVTWFLCLILANIPISYGLIPVIDNQSLDSSETGPSIDWEPEPIPTLFMDGAYTGQTQEIFEWWAWVNDSLGVDSVILRFKWSYEEEWVNRTTVLVEGDQFLGRYIGNRTWPAPGGGTFQLKIFANNTLGYWNETSPMTVRFGYLYYDPLYLPQFWVLFVILPIVSLIGLVGVWKLRQKPRSS